MPHAPSSMPSAIFLYLCEKQKPLNSRAPILLLSTAYLPPVAYMAWLAVAEKAEIEIHETYPKQTWRNRCSIPSANGLLSLSIPVEKPLGNHTPTGLVTISRHLPWQKQHWKSIVSAYSKSAFFLYYQDFFDSVFQSEPPELLSEWNQTLLTQVCRAIGMNPNINYTKNFEKEAARKTDLRYSISPKEKTLQKLSQDLFPEYFQPFSDRIGFAANQSVIDLLFNLGPDALPYLQNCGKNLADQFSKG